MLVIVSIIVAPLLLFAPLVVRMIAAGFDDTLQALTTTMIQWMLLAVPCMIIAGVMTAVLQARQQFVFPAFVTSVFNIGIIIANRAICAHIWCCCAGARDGAWCPATGGVTVVRVAPESYSVAP